MLQNNNIENQLRDLDEQQQLDLGHMDAHWQQMQAMLQPGALPVKKGFPKWMLNALSIATIIVLISAVFLYLSTKKDNGNNAEIPKNVIGNEKNEQPVVVPVKDSTEENTGTSNQGSNDKVKNSQVVYSKYFSDDDSVFANMKINFTPCESCPVKKDTVLKPAYINRPALLQNLFIQVEKEAQQFTVDNSRDTLLRCAEGSVILIPASSFGGKQGIVFTVKEFYKESDIILNQLSTLSNKVQLVTGGMLQIKATLNGNDVTIDPAKPLRLYMADTSSAGMNEMQLFNGESKTQASNLSKEGTEPPIKDVAMMDDAVKTNVNWLPQYQYFSRKKMITQVRVLNIIDQPFKIKETRKGDIGYFIIDKDSITIDKDSLKQLLKEKYGYYKIRLRSNIRNFFSTTKDFNHEYAENIGDSVWMDKETADRYKLKGTAKRQFEKNEVSVSYTDRNSAVYIKLSQQSEELMKAMQNKYSVDIKTLGWINCDRFYNDSGEKIDYAVNIGDSARNYYTMLVFDNIKSILNGYPDGKRVIFSKVPKGEKVKIISIGIDKTGETVYALQTATINTQELPGLQFEVTSTPDLKASLSKMDR